MYHKKINVNQNKKILFENLSIFVKNVFFGQCITQYYFSIFIARYMIFCNPTGNIQIRVFFFFNFSIFQ